MDEPDELLTPKAAADMLGVSVTTIYRHAAAGSIVATSGPTGIRISRQSILDRLSEQPAVEWTVENHPEPSDASFTALAELLIDNARRGVKPAKPQKNNG